MNPLVVPRDPSSAPPEVADHILIRRVGKGAYGEVWMARNMIGRFRAVKIIYRGAFSDERPFQREFDGVRKFEPVSRSHPGLVTILQFGENAVAGYFYYVMELADDARTGQIIDTETYVPRTLAQEMKLHGRLPLEKGLEIALLLASALAHLHAQKLIHRDIKPSNIIFVNGAPKFADVGLITETGADVSAVGSFNYMPPEGPGAFTGDVFSLGKVLYELFMGLPSKCFPELPDAAEDFKSQPALLQINNLILKSCHSDPRERFQTALELHTALLAVTEMIQGRRSTPPTGGALAAFSTDADTDHKAMAAHPVGVSSPSPPAEGGPGSVNWRRKWIAVLAAAVLLTGAAFFVAKFIQGPPVVVIMDTKASDGIYDPDNKEVGASNAKEVVKACERENLDVRAHPVSVYAGWSGESEIISLRPDLLIVHRSSFHHSYNAVFNFGRATNGFASPVDDAKWSFLYEFIGDDKLISVMGIIGNEVPKTKLLVYSRGTDTNWLSAGFRALWVKKIEARHPKLKNRIFTMVIPGGYEGSFRKKDTSDLLRTNVTKILNLPDPRPSQRRY